MKRLLAGAVALLSAVPLLTAAPAGAAPPAQPTVIPRPVSLTTLSGSSFQLTAGSAIVVRTGQDPAVRGVADYLAAVLRPSTGYALPVVDAPTGTPSIELDATGGSAHGQEGYRLHTEGTGRVLLQAHTAEGLSRGVQTLRQLLPARVEASTVQPGPWTIAPVDVTDAPRFAYRGAMLDVARRFVPVADVKRFIEQAARYKVNVFHWHLTDDQGWRLPSTAFPALNQVGASTQSGWAPGTGGPWFYTEADYRSIVEFAAQRYVTVVPEVDGPGHTAAAMASVPGLNCDDRARAPYYGFDVRVSILCLTDPAHQAAAADFITRTLTEAAALSPGRYVHIGGDEVPAVTPEQYSAYIRAATDAAAASGKQVVGWHQVADAPLPAGSVIQYWGEEAVDRPTIGTGAESVEVRQVRRGLAQGARVLLSPADRAYLDMKYDSSTPYGLSWAGYTTVQEAYSWDPVTVLSRPDGTQGLVTEAQVAGVEAPLWSDRAYSPSTSLPTSLDQFPAPAVYLDFMTFPRLPALAETAWSPASAKDWRSFRARLAAHGPRWTHQGIGFFRSKEIAWP